MSGGLASLVPILFATNGRPAVQTLMNGAVVVEAVLLSFLVALGIVQLALRGLFWLMPTAGRSVRPARFVADRREAVSKSHTA